MVVLQEIEERQSEMYKVGIISHHLLSTYNPEIYVKESQVLLPSRTLVVLACGTSHRLVEQAVRTLSLYSGELIRSQDTG